MCPSQTWQRQAILPRCTTIQGTNQKSSFYRIESGAWRWPCVAPLAGPSVGVVDRKRGENISEVVGFLVVHQSGQASRMATEGRRATRNNQDYKLHCNCNSQRRRVESNPYNPWTGGNHQVSRVGWDEESGGDEGGHLHQGPHLILRQGVARVWWSTW